MMILVSYLFQNNSQVTIYARVVTILFLFFVYELLCTSKYCTVGQKMTGIRVRSMFMRHNISIPKAYLRIITKLLFGILSFFTIPFTKKKRVVHDIIAGSIVIENEV